MKTGSLNMPRILGKASLMKVSGGLNFNYQPPPPQPQNYINLNISGYGGSNLHSNPQYNVGLNVNVAVTPNISITGSINTDSMQSNTITAIGTQVTW